MRPSVIRAGATQDLSYWERRFAEGDPWGIDESPEERLVLNRFVRPDASLGTPASSRVA